jgi:L,D-transpeptidase-like protein
VSTGISRYATPTGTYKPFRMEEDHFSEEWDDAPMPHSIFFTPLGHAIHGTEHVDKLGHAASHGCVRLAPEDAATLYALVEEAGMANTTVVVKGSASKPVKTKPPQLLVETPPEYMIEDTAQRLVESPPQFLENARDRPAESRRHRRLRRSDDPFLESFN